MKIFLLESDDLNIHYKNSISMVVNYVVISSRTGTYSTDIGMTMNRLKIVPYSPIVAAIDDFSWYCLI